MSSITKNPPGSQPPQEEMEDEEDDYMNMTFDDPQPSKPETSLQRRQREKKEAAARGMVKSKAQLAAEDAATREAALSRSMLENPTLAAKKSKGFAMMAKMGFKPGGGLGSSDNAANARVEPIGISVKENRGGIGLDSDRKRRIQEAAEGMVKKARVDEMDYRERIRREREGARMEKLVYAAQKIAEGMDEERGGEQVVVGDDGDGEGGDQDEGESRREKKRAKSSAAKTFLRPLKSINVLWRGIVRAREEKERDRRMRHDLENVLSRLPTYEDDQEDEDDRKALGKTKTIYVTAEDLDEEDTELDEFNALGADEKLQRIVEFLRREHNYCFWCKYTYPDETMDGCPGVTEEDHD